MKSAKSFIVHGPGWKRLTVTTTLAFHNIDHRKVPNEMIEMRVVNYNPYFNHWFNVKKFIKNEALFVQSLNEYLR
jgi:hypothetical protein